jgi:hypothetical protein
MKPYCIEHSFATKHAVFSTQTAYHTLPDSVCHIFPRPELLLTTGT